MSNKTTPRTRPETATIKSTPTASANTTKTGGIEMNRIARNLWTLTAIAGLVFGVAASAPGAIIVFSDDFDTGETVGNTPTNWTDNSDDNQSVAVSSTESASSPNSMYFNDTSTVADGAAIADATFTQTTSDIVEWEFSWREDNEISAGTYGGMLRARLQDASGTDGLLLKTTGEFDAGFDLSYRGPLSDTVIGTISENTWNTIRVVADMTAETADVYLNDALKLTDLDFRNSVSSFSKMRFDSSFGAEGVMYVDDISVINPIPEPTSLALLGLGVTALLARRRRRR